MGKRKGRVRISGWGERGEGEGFERGMGAGLTESELACQNDRTLRSFSGRVLWRVRDAGVEAEDP